MRHNQLGTILPGLVANTDSGLSFQDADVDSDGFVLIEQSESRSAVRQQTQFSSPRAIPVKEPEGRRAIQAGAELAAKPTGTKPAMVTKVPASMA